jgi:stalled ribosome rescue protein Dom34
MSGNSGIWIDHQEAFIVFTNATAAETIEEGVDKHVKFSGHGTGHEGSDEAKRQGHNEAQLGKFYDEVITHVSEAESILLFGPGEAKGELEKRLTAEGLGKRIVGVEPAERMSNGQIVAKVRKHYEK